MKEQTQARDDKRLLNTGLNIHHIVIDGRAGKLAISTKWLGGGIESL